MTDQDSNQQKFIVREGKGWFWVIEVVTNYAYAQTDHKERAYDICKQLNAGKRDFD